MKCLLSNLFLILTVSSHAANLWCGWRRRYCEPIRRENEAQKETFQQPVLARVQLALYNEICLNQTEEVQFSKYSYSCDTNWACCWQSKVRLDYNLVNGHSLRSHLMASKKAVDGRDLPNKVKRSLNSVSSTPGKKQLQPSKKSDKGRLQGRSSIERYISRIAPTNAGSKFRCVGHTFGENAARKIERFRGEIWNKNQENGERSTRAKEWL